MTDPTPPPEWQEKVGLLLDRLDRLARDIHYNGHAYDADAKVVQEARATVAALQARNKDLEQACATGWGEPTLIRQLQAERENFLRHAKEDAQTIIDLHAEREQERARIAELEAGFKAAVAALQAEAEGLTAERDHYRQGVAAQGETIKGLRELLGDCRLYLHTAETGWERMQGTPWMDGLQGLLDQLETEAASPAGEEPR